MKTYKKNNITIKELDDGTIDHYDENNNHVYRKCSDGKESFYINNEKVTKEEWINHYINNNFHHRYIYDILETLNDNKQRINIQNIKKHLNNIEIPNLKTKYKNVLKYYKYYKILSK